MEQMQPGAVAPATIPIPEQVSPNGLQPISDEQKQELLGIIKNIKGKLGSLSAVRFAAGNKNELLRRDLLKQVFEKLQISGIDLSSKEAVASFISTLQEGSPELAAMFENAMDVLLGGPEGGSFGKPQDPNDQVDLTMPPQNNMNNTNPNEAVQEGE